MHSPLVLKGCLSKRTTYTDSQGTHVGIVGIVGIGGIGGLGGNP